MKKLVYLVLSLLLLLSIVPNSVLADKNNGPDDFDNIDYSHLTPEQIVLMNDLLENDPGFILESVPVAISSRKFYLDHDGHLMDQLYIHGKPLPRLSSSEMTITIYVGRTYNPGNDTFQIYATAEWLCAPVFRLKDGFGIAWSGGFSLMNGYSCTAEYQTIGYDNSKVDLVNASPSTGIGYSVIVNTLQTLKKVRISGKISQPNTTGAANVAATYGHTVLDLSTISITLADAPSVTFSPSTSYSTLANMVYFEY